MHDMDESTRRTSLYNTNSWFMGQNIPGKKRAIVLYSGNAATYRKECQDAVVKGYEGFVLQ